MSGFVDGDGHPWTPLGHLRIRRLWVQVLPGALDETLREGGFRRANPEPIGEPCIGTRFLPDLASEVGVTERLAMRRSEHQGLRVFVRISSEVLSHEVAEKLRDDHHATAVGLGGTEVKAAVGL